MRVPTEKQTHRLQGLPAGWVVVGPSPRDWEPLAKHGWVEESTAFTNGSSGRPSYEITPDGLRALADGIEKYGVDPPPSSKGQA